MSDAPEFRSEATDAAWAAYQGQLESLRARLFASKLAAEPADRVRAQCWLMQAQAVAYNLVIAPRQDRPCFFTSTVFEPNIYTWILPNADFLYRYAFVDGAKRFRITGRRGGAHFLEAQTISGFFGDPKLKLLRTYDFDRFVMGDDGAFEIEVGPERPAECPNWIATDPASGNNTLIVREAFYDWDAEAPSSMRIAALDRLAPDQPDEADLIHRLESASRLMRFCFETFSGGLTEQVSALVGQNRFLLVDTSKDEHAANPSAGYVPAVYQLEQGQALIVTIDPPPARYWNIHLGDVWWQVTDFTNHQSSLNGHQAVRDPDGKVRIVIAAEDPGVANWLDTAGNPKGVALVRWYFAERYPEPEARLAPVDDVRAILPAETVTVTPEQRRRTIELRRDAVLRRYGR
jgi:hypothetical protein